LSKGYADYFGISEFRLTKSDFWIIDAPSRSFQRGRLAIVTDAERDAVDAEGAIDEGHMLRTAKSCGPDTLTLVSSWRRQTADDGGKRAGLTGESAKETVKPLRGECRVMPGDAGVTVVTMLVCFLFYTRGCGRIARPAFPAPSDFRRRTFLAKPGRVAPREGEGVFT
jgi:hypothetical protein